MGEFYCEEIEVESEGVPRRPVAFKWRGGLHQIDEIIDSWQDWGFGPTAPSTKEFRFRRHRNRYQVRTTSGEVFEIYLDRSPPKPVWILLKKLP